MNGDATGETRLRARLLVPLAIVLALLVGLFVALSYHEAAVGAAAFGVPLAGLFWILLGRTERRLRRAGEALVGAAETRERLRADHVAALEAEQEALRRVSAELQRNRASLLHAQRMAGLGSWEWDIVADCLSLSDPFLDIAGLEDEAGEVGFERLLEVVHPAERAEVEAFIAALLEGGRSREIEHRIVRPDGAVRVIRQHAAAEAGAGGQVVRLCGTVQDVTEARERERQSVRFGRVMEHSWNEIYVFDVADLHLVQVSEGARRNVGHDEPTVAATAITDLMPEFSAETLRAQLAPLRHGDVSELTLETIFRGRDGAQYPVEMGVQYSPHESPPVYVAIVEDVSERKAYLKELERKALYDGLTGLPNRNLLVDRLQHGIATARRRKMPLAMVLLDLNRLREINDILGHEKGDVVISEVASRLVASMRESDSVGRLGGDEFGMVLPEVSRADVDAVVGKLRGGLEAPVVIDGISLDIEASIGVAIFPEHGEQPAELLRHADVAMRLAKQERAPFRVYEPAEDPYSLRRLRLYGGLRQAINNRELLLYYQPKVDMRLQRVTAVEALVRWQHPEHGFIPPDEFVPFAEHSGLIRPFTLWVLKEAIAQCGAWRREGLDLAVAINISTRNLSDPTLPKYIGDLLRRWSVPAERITLEITENAVMARSDTALHVLRHLGAMGLHLSIDDYGTGYSSLAYLKRLPVTELKIDRSFVSAMIDEENDSVIVRSTIDLAHNLSLRTVAEGIEDREVYDLLDILGCDMAQGYYISRPLPPAALVQWFRDSVWGAAGNRQPN